MSTPTQSTDSSIPKDMLSAFNVGIHDDLPGHLYFWTRESWSGDIPVDQQDLQREFDKVCSVIRARFYKSSPERFQEEFKRLLLLAQATFSGKYVYILHGLQSLEVYKTDLVNTEGNGIKNEYLKELAKAALLSSILILLVFFCIRIGVYFAEKNSFIVTELSTESGSNKLQQAKEYKNLLSSAKWNARYSPIHFGFLLASTMWGIWLSFAVRNMNLTFDQLQNPESDLMRPWSRLLTFGLLSFILALFFQMQVLVITVGGVSTSQISDDIIVAVFVGLCLGFTDQALPKQVQKRIEEFFQNNKTSQQVT